MTPLPLHEAIPGTSCGIAIKRIHPKSSEGPLRYAHRDEYYLFGLIHEGTCVVSVDFQDYQLSQGETICVAPGSVHAFVRADQFSATLLMIDRMFVCDFFRQMIAEYALHPVPIPLPVAVHQQMEMLTAWLGERMEHHPAGELNRNLIRSLTATCVGLIVESMQPMISTRSLSRRAVEWMIRFRGLLETQLSLSRRPAYYAEQLHISSVYLNEVVQTVTGLSATQYIQREVMLHAKRQLYYTADSIQQVAHTLGFEDGAYFTRLFTRICGVNPTEFRKQYRE